MLGLSFNTKSNVPVFAVFKCQILFTFYLFTLTISTYNKMCCITSRRYDDNAKQHRFDYIFKQSSVFFPYVWPVVLYNDNEQAAFGRMFKWA